MNRHPAKPCSAPTHLHSNTVPQRARCWRSCERVCLPNDLKSLFFFFHYGGRGARSDRNGLFVERRAWAVGGRTRHWKGIGLDSTNLSHHHQRPPINASLPSTITQPSLPPLSLRPSRSPSSSLSWSFNIRPVSPTPRKPGLGKTIKCAWLAQPSSVLLSCQVVESLVACVLFFRPKAASRHSRTTLLPSYLTSPSTLQLLPPPHHDRAPSQILGRGPRPSIFIL